MRKPLSHNQLTATARTKKAVFYEPVHFLHMLPSIISLIIEEKIVFLFVWFSIHDQMEL